MANINIPLCNSLRFRNLSNAINYNDIWPSIDKMPLHVNYRRGIEANENVYINFIAGKKETFEFIITDSVYYSKYFALINIDTNEQTLINYTSISIPGWPSDSELLIFNITPAVGRYYLNIYFNFTAGGGKFLFRSDEFIVTDEPQEIGLVKLSFRDTGNSRDAYFYSDENTNFWFPNAYYPAIWKVKTSETDKTVSEDEEFNTKLLRARKKRVIELTLTDIPEHYIPIIEEQTLCDDFYVNGDKYFVESLDDEPANGNDLVNIKITMSLNKTNNYLNL